MLRGSCLCGGVRYQVTGALSGALNCHCSTCRKAHGAAFRSRARVRAADFCWVQGEDLVTYFESSAGNHRGFCRVCGSPLLSRFDHDPRIYGLPLGALDDDPGIKPTLHVFVADKAPWFDITDELPQFPALPNRFAGVGRHNEPQSNAVESPPVIVARSSAMVFDHIGFNVTDFPASKAFLLQALEPLGIGITGEGEGWAMLGRQGEGQLWVGSFGASPGPIHIAFAARTREQVRQFHAAALAAGGKDNGAPGLRPNYHPNYYGAFVIGPDGHNVEAVCHGVEADTGA